VLCCVQRQIENSLEGLGYLKAGAVTRERGKFQGKGVVCGHLALYMHTKINPLATAVPEI